MTKMTLDRRSVLLAGAAVAATAAAAPALAAVEGGANPLLQPWKGPYGGVPPFDQVKLEHFKPALEAAMAQNLKEVDAIANNKVAPNFRSEEHTSELQSH